MILGPIMMGLGLTGFVAMDIVYPTYKFIKSKNKKSKIKVITNDITEQYTIFFSNLGLLNTEKGDWIEVTDKIEKEYYTVVTFKLSDSLSIEKFINAKENIRQKLQLDNLDILYDEGKMLLKARAKDLPVIPYQFNKTNNNLIPLGVDLDGNIVYWNLKLDPHACLIGGTGSGKSNLLNCIIVHILKNYKGAKLYLVDLKGGLEFSTYEAVQNVVAYSESLKDVEKVIADVEAEYTDRLKVMKEAGYRDYSKYLNDKPNTNMKRAFFIIDEFGGLLRLNSKKDGFDAIETLIDLSKRVRAVGIHIVLATQRPTVDNIPSDLKANVSAIIGMRTRDAHNSKLVIDRDGLETLSTGESISILGNKEVFFKACYIDDSTIEEAVKAFSKPQEPQQQNKSIKTLEVLK